MTILRLINALQKNGYRIGRVRKAVLYIFTQTHQPLSALDVHNALKQNSIPANKTTIYRELDFLKHQGIINELHLEPNVRHFESAEQKHHHHLICNSCSNIHKVDDEALEKRISTLEQKVLQNNRFTITRHALEFYGTCHRCK